MLKRISASDNRKLKASMTIEAAVIIPLVMVIFVAIIFLAYYVHDQTVMICAADYNAMENAGKRQSPAYMPLLYEAGNGSMNISGTSDSVSVNYSAQFDMPLSMIRNLLGDRQNLYAETQVSFLDSRKKLLFYKSICDTVSPLIKGAQKK